MCTSSARLVPADLRGLGQSLELLSLLQSDCMEGLGRGGRAFGKGVVSRALTVSRASQASGSGQLLKSASTVQILTATQASAQTRCKGRGGSTRRPERLLVHAIDTHSHTKWGRCVTGIGLKTRRSTRTHDKHLDLPWNHTQHRGRPALGIMP